MFFKKPTSCALFCTFLLLLALFLQRGELVGIGRIARLGIALDRLDRHVELDDPPALDIKKKHDIEVVIEDDRGRHVLSTGEQFTSSPAILPALDNILMNPLASAAVHPLFISP